MALIACPDCHKEVSNNAPACPSCGAPIAPESTDTPGIRTTQETSKTMKIQTLFAVLFILVGMVWLMAASSGSPSPDGNDAVIGRSILWFGIIWYVVNRFQIWWKHR